MTEEEIKIINAADYRKQYVKTKIVKAPSGAGFKIRPISPLDYVNDKIPTAKKGDDELQSGKLFTKAVLLNCVLMPKLVDKKVEECKDNELSLDEIVFADYQFLVKEITEYSAPANGNTDFLETAQNSSD